MATGRVGQRVGDGLIRADRDPKRLALAGVGRSDLYRLFGQPDEACGSEDPHFVDGGGESAAGFKSFRQNFCLAGPAPAGEWQAAHVRGWPNAGRTMHSNNPIAVQRHDDVGNRPVGEELTFPGTAAGREGHDADALQCIAE